ncbi:MAG: hypothetical protein LBK73_07640 [Treponema sp.]|nr:hypothetical protein [Treponema sp.]
MRNERVIGGAMTRLNGYYHISVRVPPKTPEGEHLALAAYVFVKKLTLF